MRLKIKKLNNKPTIVIDRIRKMQESNPDTGINIIDANKETDNPDINIDTVYTDGRADNLYISIGIKRANVDKRTDNSDIGTKGAIDSNNKYRQQWWHL